MPESLTFYFAGDLFDTKHLVGNALLAEAIYDRSDGRFLPVLPQNLEQRDTTPHAIRDNDLFALLECDLGLFHFDGSELDSGTVVEFMFAKFADIPSVVLRTDFRAAGDQASDPWNLMASFYPRTEVVTLDAMGAYQRSVRNEPELDPEGMIGTALSSRRAKALLGTVAGEVVEAFGRVVTKPAVLDPAHADLVYGWISKMPGFHTGDENARSRLEAALRRKIDRQLL